jgi:hypothetical protein
MLINHVSPPDAVVDIYRKHEVGGALESDP